MERRASAPDIRPAVRRMINESMAQKKSPFSMTYDHHCARRNRVTPRCHPPSEATGANTITSNSSTCERRELGVRCVNGRNAHAFGNAAAAPTRQWTHEGGGEEAGMKYLESPAFG